MNNTVHLLPQHQPVLWLEDPPPRAHGAPAARRRRSPGLADRLPVPPGVVVGELDEVAIAYAELSERAGAEQALVAVRSSAADEDGLQASFAGQHETILGVRGIDELLAAIAECRASQHSARALHYRRANRIAGPGRWMKCSRDGRAGRPPTPAWRSRCCPSR